MEDVSFGIPHFEETIILGSRTGKNRGDERMELVATAANIRTQFTRGLVGNIRLEHKFSIICFRPVKSRFRSWRRHPAAVILQLVRRQG